MGGRTTPHRHAGRGTLRTSPDATDRMRSHILVIVLACLPWLAATAAAAVASLRRRGRHLQLGLMLGPDATAGLPWDLVIARELTVLGGHGMPAAEYPAMLRAIADGSLHPELLIERVIGFDDLPAALAALDDPMAAAGVVVATLG